MLSLRIVNSSSKTVETPNERVEGKQIPPAKLHAVVNTSPDKVLADLSSKHVKVCIALMERKQYGVDELGSY
jgi:hypothetical protein